MIEIIKIFFWHGYRYDIEAKTQGYLTSGIHLIKPY